MSSSRSPSPPLSKASSKHPNTKFDQDIKLVAICFGNEGLRSRRVGESRPGCCRRMHEKRVPFHFFLGKMTSPPSIPPSPQQTNEKLAKMKPKRERSPTLAKTQHTRHARAVQAAICSSIARSSCSTTTDDQQRLQQATQRLFVSKLCTLSSALHN